MKRVEEELRAVVADAIGRQLDAPSEADLESDERVQQMTAHQLVRDALAGGQFGQVVVSDLRSFTEGHTAMLVARLDTTLSFVVKVDRSPALVAEAHHLRQLATDPALPESTRRAFPKIYAVDDIGPIYGYLMENLEEYSTFASALRADDTDLSRRILEEVWDSVLAPAYRATRRRRIVPNVAEDYFVRAEQRLERAVGLGLLPHRNLPLQITTETGTIAVEGWGPLIDAAQLRLAAVVPPFSTFVHGDPNPENILWGAEPSGDLRVRLIDPKDWRTGDYLFDAAKIGHYLRVTSPVEHQGVAVSVDIRDDSATIEFDATILATHRGLEALLLNHVSEFAEDVEQPDCASWRDRYDMALSANLLGIVGPRLEISGSVSASLGVSLAWIAFAEGLRLLASGTIGTSSWE